MTMGIEDWDIDPRDYRDGYEPIDDFPPDFDGDRLREIQDHEADIFEVGA